MKQHLYRATLFILIVLPMITVVGCGIKGPPLPSIEAMVKAPTGLAFALEGETATLTWSHEKGKQAGFEIARATLASDGCEGCPLRFIPLDTVDARTFEFTTRVKPGLKYYFRVRAFTDAQVYSESSNTVQIELEP
ncbi:MAG: fibronectin type III domain-containing protein [Desulfobacterium sp.]|nr:fibronectin type III domain-containing protein [Desulfobacterium sp.]